MGDSLQAHVGDELYDRHGEKIGRITDVISEPRTLEPSWYAVKLGLLQGRHLVPVGAVASRDGHAEVPFEKAQVERTPKSDGTAPTESQEEALFAHYGWRPDPRQPA